jgi:transposase
MDEPSTPKHRKQLNRDQRLMVHTLYNAGHTQKWISTHLSFTLRQVQYVLSGPVTPKQRTGRPPVLTPEQVQELILFVRTSKKTRQMTYFELARHFEDWHIGEYVVRHSLRSAGYRRRVALQKPPLSPANRAKRVAFAEAHILWTVEQWNTILWSDESRVCGGRHRKKRVTRLPNETLEDTCVVDKVPKKRGWMFWGCFSGSRKGPALFWEKEWGSINTERYCERVVPLVHGWVRMYPGLVFMQDNASSHSSRATSRELLSREVQVLSWPPFSPDLNPIEGVWNKMKDYIEIHYPDLDFGRQRTYPQLRNIVKEAWDSITPEYLASIVFSMRERCEAVLAAQGGYTKY